MEPLLLLSTLLLLAALGYIKYQEIKQKIIESRMLNLNLQVIVADLEQIIEMTETVSKTRLLFDNRYTKFLDSSKNLDNHLVRFPIVVNKKLDVEEQNYLSQVFLVQFRKYIADSSTYWEWSDKGQSLIVTPQFGELLRYNNQYYLNLQLHFSYDSNLEVIN